jgi:predicted amidohydrolase YtcJ
MKADLLIHSALIFNGHTIDPRSSCIAVRDGKITAVGADADVRAVVSGARDVVDARGARVTLSFIDSHLHPVVGGYERLGCDLTEARTADETISCSR